MPVVSLSSPLSLRSTWEPVSLCICAVYTVWHVTCEHKCMDRECCCSLFCIWLTVSSWVFTHTHLSPWQLMHALHIRWSFRDRIYRMVHSQKGARRTHCTAQSIATFQEAASACGITSECRREDITGLRQQVIRGWAESVTLQTFSH